MVPGSDSTGSCQTLQDAFELQAQRVPSRIAVSAPDGRVTYEQLNARANRVARALRERGVGADRLVGLFMAPTVEMIVGLLGILKAGGAYVPIDPSYPASRVRLLLSDSAAPWVVTTSDLVVRLPAASGHPVRVFCIDDEQGAGQVASRQAPDAAPPAPPHGCGGRNLAYVIYTSGSTGTPKGVMVEHQSVLRLFQQTAAWFSFAQDDVWTMFHSVGFDFSVWEIWGALLHGGRLVLCPREMTRSPHEFRRLLESERVTVLNQTPSAFRQLIEADDESGPNDTSLRVVIFGGEALDVSMLSPWISKYGDARPSLVNMYGITETTVHVTYRRITAADLGRPQLSPIGIPIPDLRVRLVGGDGRMVTPGTPGEIYVAGSGLARGYLNRTTETAARFVQAPGLDPDAGDAARWYRSGDLAVALPGGELAFVGRTDGQLKVSGFRIEPQEIETRLCSHPRVAAAAVTKLDFGKGDQRLVAYVVPRQARTASRQAAPEGSEELEESEELEGSEGLAPALAKFVSAELPSHLVPSRFEMVSALPLTEHGKLDRAALSSLSVSSAPSRPSPTPGGGSTGPGGGASALEVVVRLCEEILEKRGIKGGDDFFEVGGRSLAFVRLLARMNNHFGISITPGTLTATTIRALAERAEEELR